MCRVPSYRTDLHEPHDLTEEVARIYGYDAIEATLPAGAIDGTTMAPRKATTARVKDALAGAGLTEVMTAPWIPEDEPDALNLAADDPRRPAVRLQNPIHAELPVLRAQLAGSVLRVAAQNLARQADGLRIFECCRVFHAGRPGALPDEPIEAAALMTEARAGGLWGRGQRPPVFFQLKGVVERLLADLAMTATFHAGASEPFLHPGAAGEFRLRGRTVVTIGELHPQTARRFGIEPAAALALIDVDTLDALEGGAPKYQEVSRYPSIQRDLAVLLGNEVAAGEVLEAMRKKAGASLHSVRVFDRYEGKGVPEGKVSVGVPVGVSANGSHTYGARGGRINGSGDRVVGETFRG